MQAARIVLCLSLLLLIPGTRTCCAADAVKDPAAPAAAKKIEVSNVPLSIAVPGARVQDLGRANLEYGETYQSPSGLKTSTGDTFSRVLSTPVLAPYVRVELTNRTPRDKCKFDIVAYLIR